MLSSSPALLSAATQLGRQRYCLQSQSLVVSGVVCSQRPWSSAELSAATQLGRQWSYSWPHILSFRCKTCSAAFEVRVHLVTVSIVVGGGGGVVLLLLHNCLSKG